MYAVILAGGGGTRLRPLSRAGRPKPFLPLLGDETLFQRTVARLSPLVGPNDVTVVTDRRHAGLVRAQAPGVALLEEPLGRNTAAAVALATAALERPDNEVMLVLPADHVIEREADFRRVLAVAARDLAGGAFGIADPLVTLGIAPTRDATEYGYLVPGAAPGGGTLGAHPLRRFEEKPDAARAAELRAIPGVAWNAGIFLWRRCAIREALRAFAPDIWAAVADAVAIGNLPEAYPAVRSTSIDYAVMEPAAAAGRVVMGSLDVGWSDLGTWTALLAALGAPGTGFVVEPGTTVATGPDDLVVALVGGRPAATLTPLASMTPDAPVAILRGARAGLQIVTALLDRCAAQEVHP